MERIDYYRVLLGQIKNAHGPHCMINTRKIAFKFEYYPLYAKAYPKMRLGSLLWRAIKKGLINRPQRCAYCQKVCIPEGHHITYDDAFEDVIFYCRKCHKNWHHNNL